MADGDALDYVGDCPECGSQVVWIGRENPDAASEVAAVIRAGLTLQRRTTSEASTRMKRHTQKCRYGK